MRAIALGCGLAVIGGVAFANAADLTVRRTAPVRAVVERPISDAECIRWVRQTQSWFNYCDPMPNYGLPPSHYEWGFVARR